MYLLQSLAHHAWPEVAALPDRTLAAVRNRRLYRKYLTGAIFELLSLVDLACDVSLPMDTKIGIPDVATLGEKAKAQLRILQNLPPGT